MRNENSGFCARIGFWGFQHPRLLMAAVVVTSVVVNAGVEYVLMGVVTRLNALATMGIAAAIGFPVVWVLGRAQKTVKAKNAQLDRMSAALAKSNASLARRNHDLEVFTRAVAHDIKSPLTAIVGHADLMVMQAESLTPAELEERLGVVARSGRKLAELVDALLALATMDTETVPDETVSLDVVFEAVHTRFAPVIAAQSGTLTMPRTGVSVRGRRAWIEEALANLVGNAIKYGGAPPRVAVRVAVVSEPTSSADAAPVETVEIAVVDNGIGLPPGAENQLFKPFTRLHRDHAPGHGLGLMLVREFCVRQGGDASVRREGLDGEGSTFVVHLRPADAVDTVETADAPPRETSDAA